MNPNKYTLERFDDGFAVLLLRDDETVEKLVPLKEIEGLANEGDIIIAKFHEDGSLKHVKVLKEETEESKRKIEEIYNRILNKNKR